MPFPAPMMSGVWPRNESKDHLKRPLKALEAESKRWLMRLLTMVPMFLKYVLYWYR